MIIVVVNEAPKDVSLATLGETHEPARLPAMLDSETAQHITTHLTEYLDGFIVLGYNLYGGRVMLQRTAGAIQADALQRFANFVANNDVILQNHANQSGTESDD